MALSRIQAYLLPLEKEPAGDYSFYSARVEALFDNPLLASLDEFGIPPIIGKSVLKTIGEVDNIDHAIHILKATKFNTSRLSEFERDVLTDSISAI